MWNSVAHLIVLIAELSHLKFQKDLGSLINTQETHFFKKSTVLILVQLHVCSMVVLLAVISLFVCVQKSRHKSVLEEIAQTKEVGL